MPDDYLSLFEQAGPSSIRPSLNASFPQFEVTCPARPARVREQLNLLGPGWNRPEDAVYLTGRVDSEGKTLSGALEYVVHFAKGEQPPVKGFWSLTMYDTEEFFVANPLDRVNLSQRSKFNFNEDGSLDPLHPERLTRQGQRGQLAAVSQGGLCAFPATLLAEREGPLNPRRVLDAAPGASRQVAS